MRESRAKQEQLSLSQKNHTKGITHKESGETFTHTRSWSWIMRPWPSSQSTDDTTGHWDTDDRTLGFLPSGRRTGQSEGHSGGGMGDVDGRRPRFSRSSGLRLTYTYTYFIRKSFQV